MARACSRGRRRRARGPAASSGAVRELGGARSGPASHGGGARSGGRRVTGAASHGGGAQTTSARAATAGSTDFSDRNVRRRFLLRSVEIFAKCVRGGRRRRGGLLYPPPFSPGSGLQPGLKGGL
jgi:hypothetical protein